MRIAGIRVDPGDPQLDGAVLRATCARRLHRPRSYSLASDDDDPLVEFLVERLPGGEVSELLAEVAEAGEVLELRRRIGRWRGGEC